jgi:hypothetical protein
MSAAGTLAEIVPRPVVCVVEHLRRDRVLADEACQGRYTEFGLTLELGPEPDWLGGAFPADEEWRIAFGKFYVGLDLAATFAATGRPEYQRAWERLVSSWIEQVPVGVESTDTVARRILNWVYAWSAFARAPTFERLAAGLDRTIAESLAAQARWLREHLTPARNHRTLELYGLLILALALPGLDRDGELLELSVSELAENLRRDFRPDGVHVEASTHYHLIALRSFVGALVNARRFGVTPPAGFAERVDAALDFALHCHRPDGQIPALSDADSGSYAELLALAAAELGRPDCLYVATRGERGSAPRERHVSFPDGGYHVQRSGWGEGTAAFEDERFLIFDCGPLGEGGHGHYDLLSIELAAGGRPLVLDPGRYTYHEGETNLRHWFKGTAAHNTVCVDGLDQTPYRRGKPKGAVAQGRLLSRIRSAGLDVLLGEAISPRYDARHVRRVAFVDDAYWIVEDRLVAARPHRYDIRWHLAPEAEHRVELDRDRGTVRAPGLALVFAPGPELTVEPGWYAPSYGIRRAAPVISAVLDGAADATLFSLVMPIERGAPSPRLRVLADNDAGATLEIAYRRRTDRIAWSGDGAAAGWHRIVGAAR